MNSRFYEMVDNIHGTVYYTKLEKKIINTPFFNRLHEVNQSSTVYLTFPPNRTKRYEHSLGTMQLTSDIFYNAAMNSSAEPMELLMQCAKEEFKKVLEYIKRGGGGAKLIFPFKQQTCVTMDYIKKKSNEGIVGEINARFSKLFHGNCLLNYAPNGYNTEHDAFIFLCLLQSLRIVGLLHDIGHPPQSHIIESVLEDIDYELRNIPEDDRNSRQKNFLKILDSYKRLEDQSVVQLDQEMAIITENAEVEKLHEMISLQIIKQIIDYVFPDLIENIIEGINKVDDMIQLLYYFTIIEFVFAIVRDKNGFWSGLHNIVDGTIDTDRLDFVSRDSHNSGMVWGKVPYKRLINTVKFGIIMEPGFDPSVYVCFSNKNVQQMDDLLNNRYKIFTMINFHHRSTRIASLYQRSVKLLAMDYLKSSDPDTDDGMYFSDISSLWRTIEIAYATESSVLNLIQWNDSRLNELLYHHMVEYSTNEPDNDEMRRCCEFLREIFLNEKQHTSLIKRQTQMMEINDAVSDSMTDMIQKIEKELFAVQKELMSQEKGDSEKEKEEAFQFLRKVYGALNDFDWPKIEVMLGRTIVSDSVEEVMNRHSDVVESYIMEKVKFSLGTGRAYLYNHSGEGESYYNYSNIKNVLTKARLGFPFYYIYIRPVNSIDTVDLEGLRIEIGKAIGSRIVSSLEGLIDFNAAT